MRPFITMSLAVLVLAGCASSPYQYMLEPTPINKGVTKYEIQSLNVNLSEEGANKDNTTFVRQSKLKQQFLNALRKYMLENNLLAKRKDTDRAKLDIQIDYLRRYSLGGNSLSKPEISHQVKVLQEEVPVARFSGYKYTTKYDYLEDIAVNAQVAAFSWKAKDELKDVDLISKMLVKDLQNLGK